MDKLDSVDMISVEFDQKLYLGGNDGQNKLSLEEIPALTNESYTNPPVTSSNTSQRTGKGYHLIQGTFIFDPQSARVSADEKNLAKKILNYEEIAGSERLSHAIKSPSLNFVLTPGNLGKKSIVKGMQSSRKDAGNRIVIFNQGKLDFVQSGSKVNGSEENEAKLSQRVHKNSGVRGEIFKGEAAVSFENGDSPGLNFDQKGEKVNGFGDDGVGFEVCLKLKTDVDTPVDLKCSMESKETKYKEIPDVEYNDKNETGLNLLKDEFERTSKKNFGALVIDVEEANKVAVQNIPSIRHRDSIGKEMHFFNKKPKRSLRATRGFKSAKAASKNLKLTEFRNPQMTPQTQNPPEGNQFMIIESAQKVVSQFYEKKMERLESKYENLLRNNERLVQEGKNKDSVIEVLEEENRKDKERYKSQLGDCEKSLKIKDKEIKRLKRMCDRLKSEAGGREGSSTIRRRLSSGDDDHWKLKKKVDDMQSFIDELKKQNLNLFEELENLKKKSIQQQSRLAMKGQEQSPKNISNKKRSRSNKKQKASTSSKQISNLQRIVESQIPNLRIARRNTENTSKVISKKRVQNLKIKKRVHQKSEKYAYLNNYNKPTGANKVKNDKQKSLDIQNGHLKRPKEFTGNNFSSYKKKNKLENGIRSNIDIHKPSFSSKEEDLYDNLTNGNMNLSSFLANLRRSFEEAQPKTFQSNLKMFHKKTTSLHNDLFSTGTDRKKVQLTLETNLESRLNATSDTRKMKESKNSNFREGNKHRKRPHWPKNTPTYSKYKLNINSKTSSKKSNSNKFIDIMNSTNRTKKRDFRRRKRRTLECLLKEEKNYSAVFEKKNRELGKNKPGVGYKNNSAFTKKKIFDTNDNLKFGKEEKVNTRVNYLGSRYESMKRIRYFN